MQVRLRNIKSSEIGTAFFPLERPDDFSFDTWQVVDLVRPGEEEFEESDIRCASLIYDIEPDKLPGKGEKESSKELHLFLKKWDESVGLKTFNDGYWVTLGPGVWISLINVTNDWRKAYHVWERAELTWVKLNDFKGLGEYYLEKYQRRFDRCDDFELGSFFDACIHVEGLFDVESYGRMVAIDRNGFWCQRLGLWVDCSESDEWKYWVEYGE